MSRIVTALLVVLLVGACWVGQADEVQPPEDAALPTAIVWHDSLDAAIDAAQTSGKPVMLDFYTDWCSFCRRMDAEAYPDAKVIAMSAKFECVKVDGDREPALVRKYDVKGFPTTVFLQGDRELLRNVGFVSAAVLVGQMRLALDNRELLDEIPALEARLAEQPDSAEALARLGHIYVALQQTDKALPLLSRAASLDKDGKLGVLPDVQLDRAICEVRLEDAAAAAHLATWQAGNPGHPREVEALYYRGLAQAQAGQLQAALNSFDAVIAGAPNSLDAAMAAHYAAAIRARLAPAPGG